MTGVNVKNVNRFRFSGPTGRFFGTDPVGGRGVTAIDRLALFDILADIIFVL